MQTVWLPQPVGLNSAVLDLWRAGHKYLCPGWMLDACGTSVKSTILNAKFWKTLHLTWSSSRPSGMVLWTGICIAALCARKEVIREVPRSADYEYEYVWVSRILTRWLSVPRRRYWQNDYEYNVVGRVKLAVDLPRPLSRTLRVCRPTAVVYEYTLRLSSRHFFTAVKLIRKVRR